MRSADGTHIHAWRVRTADARPGAALMFFHANAMGHLGIANQLSFCKMLLQHRLDVVCVCMCVCVFETTPPLLVHAPDCCFRPALALAARAYI